MCPAGHDLDGDGLCVTGSEPDPIDVPPPVLLDRVLLDFETDPFGLEAADLAPVRPRGQRARVLDPALVTDWLLLATPEVITHRTLALDVTTRGIGDWVDAALAVSLDGVWGGPLGSVAGVGPGRWVQHQVDVSAGCGRTVWYVLVSEVDSAWALDWTYDPYAFHNPDWIVLDDVGFAGGVCDAFVDTDGDGLCAEGVDGDGDGTCVSAGEPTPGTVQDPDE